jgi:N-sulfoglucosamine sulfohydrolase
MRTILCCLLAALWTCIDTCPALAQAGTGKNRPNILLIMSDDHHAAHLGCYGDKNLRTPNLDKLAGEGIRFTRAYVTTPQCVPSRASLMTGRSPISIHMTRFSAPLPADVITFVELLRAGGYHTGICGRNFHLDGSAMPPETKSVVDKHKLMTFEKRVDYLRKGGDGIGQMREFLKQGPAGKPWFLQVAFSDPHRPFNAKPLDPAKLVLPPHFPDTQLVREDFAGYYGEIERLDADVGRVLALLAENGSAANTIVIFIGDNGSALLRGKGTLHDFGLRVPLLVRGPGIQPSVRDTIISGEDLAPTVLEAAGVAAPKSMTGVSFAKLLRNEPFPGRTYAFGQRGAHGSGLPNNTAAFDLGRTVISKSHKLIYNALPKLAYYPVDFGGSALWKEIEQMHSAGKLAPHLAKLYFPRERPMFEVYDLQKDPFEMNNLAGTTEVAGVERELRAALQEWMILERDFVPLPVPPPAKMGKKKAQ